MTGVVEETCPACPGPRTGMSLMAQRILAMVRERRNVSFAELEGIEGFSGDHLVLEVVPNMMLWFNLSRAAADAIDELQSLGEIHPVPTSLLIYLIDGRVPNLPIAKSRREYKKPHWLPVVFNPGSGTGAGPGRDPKLRMTKES